MIINATHSESNPDKLSGYSQGLVDGQKRGKEAMKIYILQNLISNASVINADMKYFYHTIQMNLVFYIKD
jgi:hypothetical protein